LRSENFSGFGVYAQPRTAQRDVRDGGWSWVNVAIETETKLLLVVNVFDRHGTDSVISFLAELAEKHNISGPVFLVDGYGYRTVLFQIGLSGQLSYTDRNLIETRFHTLKHRIDSSIRPG
jgi:putative transposase